MANYFIIGGDGKEYGPVSTDDLRKWMEDGRADSTTKTRADGTTEWVPLSAVPELAGVQKKTPPPPLPAKAPLAAVKTSTMAILSLVFGILGLFTCGFTALFGLILGIIALVKVNNSRGELRGKGMALSGTIVSGVFLIMVPVFLALLLPALAAAKQKAQQINCVNNEKHLALAVRIYADSNGNHLPPAATWCDAIKPEAGSEKVFKCPAVKENSRCDYAFNAKLDGLEISKVNPQTVMIFESDAGWNAHGGLESVAVRHPRHRTVVALADGSVQMVSEAQLNALRWEP